jgi:hypothetical protein
VAIAGAEVLSNVAVPQGDTGKELFFVVERSDSADAARGECDFAGEQNVSAGRANL